MELEKQTLKRVTLRLVPFLIVCYFIAYLDRVNVGFAALTMNKDLGLAMAAVSSTGSAAPLGTHAAEIYAKFAAEHADQDFSAVIDMLREG